MILLGVLSGAGLILGWAVGRPVARRGIWVFAAAALGLWLLGFGIKVAQGFEGLPLADSLLLFEGSLTAYLAFSAQVVLRNFALPLFLLAGATIVSMRRAL